MSVAVHSRGPHGSGQFHVMEPVPDHQMSQEDLFQKMILKLITYFTQLIYTDACTVTFTSYCKKGQDMDMNLVLWIWSTRTCTRTQTKVLILVLTHFFSTRTRTHAKQSTRTRTRTQDLCTRPNPDLKLQKSCSRCNKNTRHVESSYILQPPKYLLLFVNRFRYIYNNVTKDSCPIPMDTTIRLGLLKFSLQAAIDHHGPSIHSGHYTASINCWKKTILLQRSHNYGVWNYW